MSDQPEALRLADALEQQAAWEARYGPSELEELLPDSATLLRRQRAEIERLYAQRSSAVEDYEKAPDWSLLEATQGALREHMAEIHRLRAERNALLEVLELAVESGCATVFANEDDECGERGCCGVVSYKPHADDCWVTKARAAIDAAREKK